MTGDLGRAIMGIHFRNREWAKNEKAQLPADAGEGQIAL